MSRGSADQRTAERAADARADLGRSPSNFDGGEEPYDEIPGFDDEFGEDGFLKRSTQKQRRDYWHRRWNSHQRT